MNGERNTLELMLTEASQHLADVREQLKDAWLMGKARLVVEFELHHAEYTLNALNEDYSSYTYH